MCVCVCVCVCVGGRGGGGACTLVWFSLYGWCINVVSGFKVTELWAG